MENLNKYRDDLTSLMNLGTEMLRELASRLESTNERDPQEGKNKQVSEQQSKKYRGPTIKDGTRSHTL